MTIVTYNTQTREVISVVPIDVEAEDGGAAWITEGDGFIQDGYEYIIYNNTDPVFENVDGKMLLCVNKFIVGEDYYT